MVSFGALSILVMSVSKMLFRVISALKDDPKPLTNQDIIRKEMVDILNTPELNIYQKLLMDFRLRKTKKTNHQ